LEDTTMPVSPIRFLVLRSGFATLGLICLLLLIGPASAASGSQAKQTGIRTFDSPDSAVAALVESLRSGDRAGLIAILGDHRLATGDQEVDRTDIETFLSGYEAKHVLDTSQPGKAVLIIGQDDWPFPVPILQQNGAWRFDTRDGMKEIFNRRIGRNELLTIVALKEYVAAQREYAATDPDRDSIHQFARRLVSTPGKRDGLYWSAADSEAESPLGALMARAAHYELISQGSRGGKPAPFNGYYFKVLTRQSGKAQGGVYDYIVGGNMMLGFACVAYPARYGDTGIMTFIVNQDGVVYEKNLGKRTPAAVKAMSAYAPDSTWTKAE
jgi:hypothetical protein